MLQLAAHRLKYTQEKMAALRQSARRGISELLAAGKDESARIRVEQIIRDDFMSEAMEIVELYCQLVIGRYALFEQHQPSHICEPSLVEAVSTIIYAAPRMNIQELLRVKEGFGAKFGKDFVHQAAENKNEQVNSKIIQKLSIYAPEPFLVEQYLKEIAKFYEIPWSGKSPTIDLLTGQQPQTTSAIDPISNNNTLSNNTTVPDTSTPTTLDFDSLAKRFEALKKRSQ